MERKNTRSVKKETKSHIQSRRGGGCLNYMTEGMLEEQVGLTMERVEGFPRIWGKSKLRRRATKDLLVGGSVQWKRARRTKRRVRKV